MAGSPRLTVRSDAPLADHNAGYPISGALALARALARRAEALGCRIHYRSRVEKILVEAGRAAGGREGGERPRRGPGAPRRLDHRRGRPPHDAL